MAFLLVAACLGLFAMRSWMQVTRCKARHAAMEHDMEQLRQDAQTQMKTGMHRADVLQFFATHDLRLQPEPAQGPHNIMGSRNIPGLKECGSLVCDSDSYTVQVRVGVDEKGTILFTPIVVNYADCR